MLKIDNYTQLEYSKVMNVKELRKQTQLSQSEFAKKYGIPVRTFQKWEQGAAEPLPYLMSLIQGEITNEEYMDVSKYFIKPSNTFKVTRKKRFKNIEHIHPIQQKNIEDILEALKQYDSVKKVVVFGSSITYKCNYDSDIDLYVELSKDENVKSYSIETPVDFWTNFNVPSAMLEEIKNKGVVVYDRK